MSQTLRNSITDQITHPTNPLPDVLEEREQVLDFYKVLQA